MDAAVVWVADAPPGDVDAATRRTLDEWARLHGVTMAVIPDGAGDPAAARPDPALARGVDDELTRARDALSALEIDAAERALARAESTLRAHPEIPQAAWLFAEVERAWSARWLRGAAPDEARASRAWQRAASLDGGRAPGVGERAFAPSGTVDATLAIDGVARDEGVTLRLDGAPIAPGAVARGEGMHQLTVQRDGAPVWSAWITLAAGVVVRVPVPPPAPCSSRDLARASVDGDRVHASAVRCPRWIAMAHASSAGARSALRVADCTDGRCGPLVEWSADPALAARAPLARDPGGTKATRAEASRRWPAWATWTLVGVAAAAATTAIVVIASGALASPPTETRFVNGGVRPAGWAF